MNVKPYNFKKPGPLDAGSEHRVSHWLRTGCALATRNWAKVLPFPLEWSLKSLDTIRTADILGSLSEAVLAERITLCDNWPGLMVWPRPLVLALTAGLMNDFATQLPLDRELTLVEESLFEYFLKDFVVPPLWETWTGTETLKPVIGPKESHPRWLRWLAPDETMVSITTAFKGDFGEHEWQWWVPQKGLADRLGPPRQGEEDSADLSPKNRLESLVRDLPVEVRVVLGSVELFLSQLARLREGDVILLDQRVNQPVIGWVSEEKKMRGWPCRVGTRQAIQIESFVNP